MASDELMISVLALSDLSAAFDNKDYHILIQKVDTTARNCIKIVKS